MSLDELKEQYSTSVETTSDVFHELCAMVEALEVYQYFDFSINNYLILLPSLRSYNKQSTLYFFN